MRRVALIAALVFLLVLDARSVIEVWERVFVHSRYATVEMLSSGAVLYWTVWVLVGLLDLGVLWLTIRVAKRLRRGAIVR
jgi:hypothetical protein